MRFSLGQWIVGVVLLLFGAFVLLVFIPVHRDRDVRALAAVGLDLGSQVADRLLIAAPGQGLETEDGMKYLPGRKKDLPVHVDRIQVMKDGVVRVSFKSPDELVGKEIEIRTTGKDGKLTRECRSLGIHDRFLPARCRSDAGLFPVKGPK